MSSQPKSWVIGRLTFRNLLALIVIISIFALVYAMGAGFLKYTDDVVKGIIMGSIMQWGALVIQFYFRKRPADESSNGGNKGQTQTSQ